VRAHEELERARRVPLAGGHGGKRVRPRRSLHHRELLQERRVPQALRRLLQRGHLLGRCEWVCSNADLKDGRRGGISGVAVVRLLSSRQCSTRISVLYPPRAF
jgi:hypothetical protein